MTQKRVYQVPIQLRQRLVQTWPEFQHSVVDDATDHWRRRLDACSLSTQMTQHISAGLLANVLYATARPSVVCLSCGWNFRQFLRRLVRWPSVDIHEKIYIHRPRETPPSGELNTTGVTKYSDFGPIEGYISIGGKLVLITYRKS